MRRSNRLLQPLLEPRWSPLLFLAAAVLLGAVGNALYDVLQLAFATPLAVLLLIVSALVAITGLYWLYGYLVGREVEMEDVAPHRALIALVSNGAPETNPAWVAMRYHLGEDGAGPAALTYCYLVADRPAPEGTCESPTSSWSNALQIKEALKERLLFCEVIPVRAEDCEDIKRQCDRAYRLLRAIPGLRRDDIIADLTGGTKRMTIGMVLSAMETGCELEYLQPRRLLPDGRPDLVVRPEPRRVSLRFFLRGLRDEE